MKPTIDLTHISLFTGIGGIDLGLEWAGFSTIATCDNNRFAHELLKKRFPNANHHRDIYETDFTQYANQATILSGGFPCQPFSIAGLRRGARDNRYLWPEMRRAYREAQPRWIIAENVPGITSLAFNQSYATVESGKATVRYYQNILLAIIEQLEEDGYQLPKTLDGQPIILSVPAAGVNAPHKRQRIFIIAHKNTYGGADRKLQTAWREWFNGDFSPAGAIWSTANTVGTGGKKVGKNYKPKFVDQANKIEFSGGRLTQSPVCRRNHGIPNRVDRLEALGNAVVPQIPYVFGTFIRTIEEFFNEKLEVKK